MFNNLRYAMLLPMLLYCSLTKAQITTSFSFGNISLPDSSIVSYSGPVIMDQSNSCFTVRNGVPVFNGANFSRGKFIIACEANAITNYSFELFPNPALLYTKLYVNGTIVSNEKYNLFLYNASGILLRSYTGNFSQLMPGLFIDMSAYPAGVYLIKISTSKSNTSLKFIKTGD